jgi:hypothetical protein
VTQFSVLATGLSGPSPRQQFDPVNFLQQTQIENRFRKILLRDLWNLHPVPPQGSEDVGLATEVSGAHQVACRLI